MRRLGINPAGGRKQAKEQSFLGHFEAEDGDGQLLEEGDIFGDIEGQGGLAHGGARGEDNQFGRLEACCFAIEARVACGKAGDAAALGKEVLEAVEIFGNELLDINEAGADAVFGEPEDLAFGLVEDGIGFLLGIEGALLDGVCGVDEAAQEGFFPDDAGVMLDVGDARDAIGELSEIGGAASGIQALAACELFAEGDEIDGLALFAECGHGLEDAAVGIEEEILWADFFEGGVEGMVIEEDGAEDGALGVEILRERAIDGGGESHWHNSRLRMRRRQELN